MRNEFYMPCHTLLCPICLSSYTRPKAVEVVFRNEDEQGTPFRIDSRGCNLGFRENPSTRRDGISIEFECEKCEVKFVVTVAQVKGQSFLDTYIDDESFVLRFA